MSNELIEFVLISIALLGIGIYGLAVKRNAIRMLFAVEIIVNAANLNLVAFARFMPHSGGQTLALFSHCNRCSRSCSWPCINYRSISYVQKY